MHAGMCSCAHSLIVGPKANAIAIAKARVSGSGWVAVRNTNHFGIAGAYVHCDGARILIRASLQF